MLKTIQKAIGALLLTGGFVMLFMPAQAMAAGATASGTQGSYDVNGMISKITSTTGIQNNNVNDGTFITWASSLTSVILGVAVTAFVLRVILTAVNRMIFSSKADGFNTSNNSARGGNDKNGDSKFNLTMIPLIGAYDDNIPWKNIWIDFAKNMVIVLGAWILVNFLINVGIYLFGVATS